MSFLPGDARLCGRGGVFPRCGLRRETRAHKIKGLPGTGKWRAGAEKEMASQSQGIQQLLQAEKRAAEKVADARKRKARRLKQAKEEAQMEVEQYRRERELEFQSKQQAAMGSQGDLSAEVEQATRRQVQGMQSSQQKNRERVLAQLLGMVCDVRPQVHPNYRIAA